MNRACGGCDVSLRSGLKESGYETFQAQDSEEER